MKFVKWLTVIFLVFSGYMIFYVFSINPSIINNEIEYNHSKPKATKENPIVLEKTDTSVVSSYVPENNKSVDKSSPPLESVQAVNPEYITCMSNINNCISCTFEGVEKDCRSLEFENNYQKIESLRSWPAFSEYLDKILLNQNGSYLHSLTNFQLRDLLINFSNQSGLDYDEILINLGIDKKIPPNVMECKVPNEKFCFGKDVFND